MKQNSFSKRGQLSKMSGKSRGGMSFTLMTWLCVAFMLIFFSMPAGADAATLVYDGDGDKLQDLPDWALGDEGFFFPGTTDAPLASNNSVIVDYDPEDLENDNPNGVLGGLSQSAVSFNTVEMRRGETTMIFGGYAMNMIDEGISVNASVSANGNSLEISGGKVLGVAVGGSAQMSVRGSEVDMLSVVLSAAARDNTVNISGGAEVGEVYGGIAGAGTEVGGSADVTATAAGNKANVNGGNVHYRVYGGAVYGETYAHTEDSGAVDAKAKATASENEAAVSDSEIGDDVYGGYAEANAEAAIENVDSSAAAKADATADASGNKASVSGSEIRYDAFGGYANAGAAAYNDGGGAADAIAKATASNNEKTIYDSHIYYYLSGGRAYADANSNGDAAAEAAASGNAVTVSDSEIGDDVYGGLAIAYAEAVIENVDSSAAAKADATADASGNKVSVSGSEIRDDAYGGYADAEADAYNDGSGAADAIAKATASNNEMTAYDSHIYYYLSGGEAYADANGNGDAAAEATASGNTVTADNGSTVEHGVWGGYASARASGNGKINAAAAASGNTANVSDSEINDSVYGSEAYAYADAYSDGNADAAAAASGNAVTVRDSEINGNVGGGEADAYADGKDAASAIAAALSNTVDIGGSVINWGVYGGRADASAYSDGNTDAAATASGNTVNIGGGTLGGNIYGGYAYAASNGDTAAAEATASGNTVSISDSTLGGNIYGGYADAASNGGTAAAFATDNTVSLSGELSLLQSWIYGGYCYVNGTVEMFDFFTGNRLEVRSRSISVFGVENFEFYDFYLPEDVSAADTMLSVTYGVDMDASYANIYLQGETNLAVGDIVTLIESGGGVSKPLNDGEIVSAKLGSLLMYDFLVYVSDDAANLYASYEGGGLSRGNGALGNSRLGSMAFLGQGADLSAGLNQFTTSGSVSGSNLTSFGGVLGGSSTYETGSDVEVKGWSLIAGVTKDVPTGGNSLKLSAFIEAGWGDYDTDNSYSGTSVKGSGDMDYFGGGLHARYMWLNGEKPGGWYVDGSVKVGKVNSDFSCWDLTDQFGRHLNYDVDSTYYGAHAGLGREWKLNEKTTIDVSSKFLWTRLEGDEFTTSTGDRVRFDDVDSYRWRTGFRVTSERTERVSIYGGLYYEYEFDGDAAGWLFGTYSLDKSSLGGGTGIGELGVTFKPSAGNDRLTMGIGAQGYVGTREGVSCVLKLQYQF